MNETINNLNEEPTVRLGGKPCIRTQPHHGSDHILNVPMVNSPLGQREHSRVVVSEEAARKYKNVGSNLKYLTVANPKTTKGLGYGYVTAILHLAPANYGGYTTCHRFKQCATSCLYHQGRGRFTTTQNARIRKTKELFETPNTFFMGLHSDISGLQYRLRGRDNPKLCVRLNGTSDILWEDMKVTPYEGRTIFDEFPHVEFYDYTKYKWGTRTAWNDMPMNYHLTYSYDGTEEDVANAMEVLENGWNVNVIHTETSYNNNLARISKGQKHAWGYPMFDNELNDLRFLDAKPMVLIGKEKGYSNIAV
jgi:hypothetical protein